MTLLNHHWTRRQSGIISPPTRDEAFPTISNALSSPTPATCPSPQPITRPQDTPTPLFRTSRTATACTAIALLKTIFSSGLRVLAAGGRTHRQAAAWHLTRRRPPIPGRSGAFMISPQYLYRCAPSVVGVDTYLSRSGLVPPKPTTRTPASLPPLPPSG